MQYGDTFPQGAQIIHVLLKPGEIIEAAFHFQLKTAKSLIDHPRTAELLNTVNLGEK